MERSTVLALGCNRQQLQPIEEHYSTTKIICKTHQMLLATSCRMVTKEAQKMSPIVFLRKSPTTCGTVPKSATETSKSKTSFLCMTNSVRLTTSKSSSKPLTEQRQQQIFRTLLSRQTMTSLPIPTLCSNVLNHTQSTVWYNC